MSLRKKTLFFENYKKENILFQKQIQECFEDVLNLESEYAHEQYVKEFEEAFAEYNKTKYVVAVNSGTTALEMALHVNDIQVGDEVIVPSYTYVSTALAISYCGAIPVFADISPETLTLNPDQIEGNITKKTKAILPVHIHGNPCKMDEISRIAKKNSLIVIEDCSHAHGAEYKNKKVGNFGMGCFSCHTSKFFSGIGNSGIITTNSKDKYEKLKIMMDVRNDPDESLFKRVPCRMDAIQAGILKAKLPYLDKIIDLKRKIAKQYCSELLDLVNFQKEETGAKHVYRDFVIQQDNVGALKEYLRKKKIETKRRYTKLLHLTKYYQTFPCKRGNLVVTEEICHKLLCLPISFTLTKEVISRICSSIKEYKG